MGGRWAWYERLIWPLSAGHSVGAHQLGLGKVGREEEWQGNSDSETGSAHAQSSRATRRARLLRRFWTSASDKTTPCCSLQRTEDGGANLRVVFRRSPSLLVKTVPLFVRVLFPSFALSSEPRPTAAATRGAGRACASLFVAAGSVCQKAGWRLLIGWPVKCGPRRGTNALSRFWVPERFVALSLSLTSS